MNQSNPVNLQPNLPGVWTHYPCDLVSATQKIYLYLWQQPEPMHQLSTLHPIDASKYHQCINTAPPANASKLHQCIEVGSYQSATIYAC